MSIKTVIVDLESIQVPPIPAVSNNLIETLANSIVELRGLLRPPVLRTVGIEEYEVLSGQLEFYAYLQARKFDDSLPDRLTAIIVDKKNEAAVQKQLAVAEPTINSPSDAGEIDLSNLEAKIDRLFSNQHKSIDALQASLLSKLDQALPQPLPMLVAFDRVAEPAIALQISNKLAFLGDAKVKKILALLQSAKNNGQSLTSIANVQTALTEMRSGKQTKVIGDKKMLEIVDRWQQ